MSQYRNALPQLTGGLFLTNGGIETALIFHEGLELPDFAAFHLLRSPEGEAALYKYFRTYLGGLLAARCEAYRELFRVDLDAKVLGEIRDNLNRCRALGSERFKDAIEAALHRTVRPGKAGRPRKKTTITPYFYSLPSIRRASCAALNCRHKPGR